MRGTVTGSGRGVGSVRGVRMGKRAVKRTIRREVRVIEEVDDEDVQPVEMRMGLTPLAGLRAEYSA